MRTIWKYELRIADEQKVRMPQGSRILSVGNQNGTICIWALVHSDSPLSDRKIRMYGTGYPCYESSGNFVGTVQDGPLVWHVFA